VINALGPPTLAEARPVGDVGRTAIDSVRPYFRRRAVVRDHITQRRSGTRGLTKLMEYADEAKYPSALSAPSAVLCVDVGDNVAGLRPAA
jgi:hypothetical protein